MRARGAAGHLPGQGQAGRPRGERAGGGRPRSAAAVRRRGAPRQLGGAAPARPAPGPHDGGSRAGAAERGRYDTLLARTKPQEKEGESAEAKAKHDAHKELAKEAGKLKKGLEKLEARLWQGTDTKGIPPPDDALSQIQTVQWLLSSTYDPPTAAQTAYLAEAEATLRAALAEVNKFLAEDLAAFRKKLQESDLRLLQELPPLAIEGE